MRLAQVLPLMVFASCRALSPVEIPASEWFLLRGSARIAEPFRSSTVLVRRTAVGWIGWVIGRPFRGEPPFAARLLDGISIWDGGPVERDKMSYVYLDTGTGSLHFSRELDTLVRISAIPGERGNVRVFVGYCGWAPGQLEREIKERLWTTSRESIQEFVFGDPGVK